MSFFHNILNEPLQSLLQGTLFITSPLCWGALLQLRSIPDPTLLARSDDIVRIFIMACECKNVKLRITGLTCLQKWVAHGAVPVHSLPEILGILNEVRALVQS